MSIAAITGPESFIEVGPSDLGAVFAEQFTWTVHEGAVVVQRWREAIEGESEQFRYPFKVLDSVELGLEDGEVVTIVRGEVRS